MPASVQKERHIFRYIRHAINYVIHHHRSIISLLIEDGTRISKHESVKAGQTLRYHDFSDLETARYGYAIIGRISCYYENRDYPIHIITAFTACIVIVRKLENLRDLLSRIHKARDAICLIFHKYVRRSKKDLESKCHSSMQIITKRLETFPSCNETFRSAT